VKAALALSGGGIRAVAHLGAVEVLQAEGIGIPAISGSSGGALVGALLCDGKSPAEIVDLIKEVRIWDLFGSSGRGGVFALEKIRRILEERLSVSRIEELAVDFTVACTDLAAGEVCYFDKGPIAELCVASSSLVPVFSPIRYGDRLLADGGFMDNMPAAPLQKSGCPVVGINVNPVVRRSPERIVQTTVRALMLMMAANIEASKRFVDFYIEPEGCERINIFDLRRVDEAYEAGRNAARAAMPKLIETLASI